MNKKVHFWRKILMFGSMKMEFFPNKKFILKMTLAFLSPFFVFIFFRSVDYTENYRYLGIKYLTFFGFILIFRFYLDLLIIWLEHGTGAGKE